MTLANATLGRTFSISTRKDLGLGDGGANGGNGVCQPVRIYRDSVGILTKSAYEVALPFALDLVAQGIGTTGSRQAFWFGTAVLILLIGYLIRHRSMLGDYGLREFLE